MKKIKIICTLGPSSFNPKILSVLKKEKVDIFRINLSHTDKKDIKKKILFLKKNNVQNICIDTEGAQIRTTYTKRKYFLKKNTFINIGVENNFSNNKCINFYPRFNLEELRLNCLIYVGFESLCLRLIRKDKLENNYLCKVVKEGLLESKKGVHINKKIYLDPLTKKDIYALQLGRKMKIKNYAISFVNSGKDLKIVKDIIGKNNKIISKIETANAVKNLTNISKNSNALLIDRGDLSRYIPIEKIPIIQERVISFANSARKPVYVATNLLENMVINNLPTRAESNDIYSSLKQGSEGLVLAAETAIGKDPVNCVKFLKKCILAFKNRKKK